MDAPVNFSAAASQYVEVKRSGFGAGGDSQARAFGSVAGIAPRGRLRYGMHVKAFLSATLPGGVSFQDQFWEVEMRVRPSRYLSRSMTRYPTRCGETRTKIGPLPAILMRARVEMESRR